MMRFLFGCFAIGVILAAGCVARTPQSAASVLDVVTSTATPTVRATLTPLASVCGTFLTPQPTQTPGPGNPTRNPLPTATRFPAQGGQSRLVETRFHAAAVDRDMTALVYLPPGYFDSERRYPVLYMLSGFSGDEHEWVNMGICDSLEQLIRGGYIQPMIVVLPSGNQSWWFNHAPPPGGDGMRWGDYVWQDVVGMVDGSYRTLPQAASRAIGGLSAGGQSALMLGMTHPDVFRIIGAHSPSFRGADGSVPDFGTWDFFNQYDPVWLVQNTDTTRQLTIWIDVAAGDYQWRNCNPPPSPQRCIAIFHEMLDAKGIPHDYQDSWAGIHDDFYWSAHIPDYLMWYSSKLVGQATQ